MASLRKEFLTRARADDVWSAVRDIGALHTRLVPGFVTDTKLEPGARVVTFGNGMVVREPIVTIDDASKRLVWSAEGQYTTHYNASVQVFAEGNAATRVVWIADFLPDTAAGAIGAAMEAGSAIMKRTLDRLAEQSWLGRKALLSNNRSLRQATVPFQLGVASRARVTATKIIVEVISDQSRDAIAAWQWT